MTAPLKLPDAFTPGATTAVAATPTCCCCCCSCAVSTVTATVALPTGYLAERREQKKRTTFGAALTAIGLGAIPVAGLTVVILQFTEILRFEAPLVFLVVVGVAAVVLATLLAAAGRSPRPERVAARTALWALAVAVEFFVVL